MNDRRVLYVTLIVATIAVLATLMVAVLAITDANASEKPCPPHSTIQNYSSPDQLSVYVDQPVGEPHWAYVVLIAPDGQRWTIFEPLHGPFTNTIPGQWRVCFTENLQAVLDATGWTPPTTVAPPVAETIPCTDETGAPGILHPDGTCWTEQLYNDTFSDENLATVPSHTDPGRSVADVSNLDTAASTHPAERPRYFAGVELPSFARIIAMQVAL